MGLFGFDEHACVAPVWPVIVVIFCVVVSVIIITEVPTLPFWAEDLPLYVISPVLPFDRKISR